MSPCVHDLFPFGCLSFTNSPSISALICIPFPLSLPLAFWFHPWWDPEAPASDHLLLSPMELHFEGGRREYVYTNVRAYVCICELILSLRAFSKC